MVLETESINQERNTCAVLSTSLGSTTSVTAKSFDRDKFLGKVNQRKYLVMCWYDVRLEYEMKQTFLPTRK
jgi:hypothetical protein